MAIHTLLFYGHKEWWNSKIFNNTLLIGWLFALYLIERQPPRNITGMVYIKVNLFHLYISKWIKNGNNFFNFQKSEVKGLCIK